MTNLDQQLRDLTVEIICKHCDRAYDVKLTGFSGICVCKNCKAIKNFLSTVTISKKDTK